MGSSRSRKSSAGSALRKCAAPSSPSPPTDLCPLQAPSPLCRRKNDDRCSENARTKGGRHVRFVDCSPAEALEDRLDRLLVFRVLGSVPFEDFVRRTRQVFAERHQRPIDQVAHPSAAQTPFVVEILHSGLNGFSCLTNLHPTVSSLSPLFCL